MTKIHEKQLRRGWLVLALCSLFFLPQYTRANDYLELQRHYSIYAAGQNCIHVKIPIWAYGRWNNYYASGASYLYYQEQQYDDQGNVSYGQKWFIMNYKADRQGDNILSNGIGSGEVHVTPDSRIRVSVKVFYYLSEIFDYLSARLRM